MGQKIETTILDALELTLTATYSGVYKKDILRKTNNKIDLLKYLIRLAHETNSIKIKHYLLLEEKALDIGKDIGSWIKSIK